MNAAVDDSLPGGAVRFDKPELAVFGGSFDPPHLGHVLLAGYALSIAAVERVVVAPAF